MFTITAGLGFHALGLAIVAISIIFAALMLATARAPWMLNTLTGQAFLGFAICEGMAFIILLISLFTIHS